MTRRFQLALVATAMLSSSALAGPNWVEMGDAGKDLLTAELIMAGGPMLTSISGELTGPTRGVEMDLADMYVFAVTEPLMFHASTVPAEGGAAEFDTNLWLFRITAAPPQAFGLLANRDAQPGSVVASRMGNAATDATGAMLLAPGRYALAISGGNHVPVSAAGAIFTFAEPGEVSGPDGPGGSQPQVDFAGPGQTGTYRIVLSGSAPLAPEPTPAVSDVGLVIMALILICAATFVFNRRPAPARVIARRRQ